MLLTSYVEERNNQVLGKAPPHTERGQEEEDTREALTINLFLLFLALTNSR